MLVVSTQQCWKYNRTWGHGTTWYSYPRNQVLVSMRLTHAMMTPDRWTTQIRQTQEQDHQTDDTDVCGTVLMIGIHITII